MTKASAMLAPAASGELDDYSTRLTRLAPPRPRRDPVVYGAWNPEAPLSPEQLRQFDELGYLVFDDLFSDEEVALVQHEAEALLAREREVPEQLIISEPKSEDVRSIFAIHEVSPVMQRLASDVRLAGAASYILDDRIYLHQSRLNYKPGFGGGDFFWHSDFETWHAEDGMPRPRALSMSVLLTDNSEQNGPLLVIPGSHRTFLPCLGETPEDHYLQSLRRQEVGTPDRHNLELLAQENGIVSLPGRPGTVIAFDCNLIHGSNGNITPFPRSNAFFVFNALSNRLAAPFAAPRPRPEFIASRSPEPLDPIGGKFTPAVS